MSFCVLVASEVRCFDMYDCRTARCRGRPRDICARHCEPRVTIVEQKNQSIPNTIATWLCTDLTHINQQLQKTVWIGSGLVGRLNMFSMHWLQSRLFRLRLMFIKPSRQPLLPLYGTINVSMFMCSVCVVKQLLFLCVSNPGFQVVTQSEAEAGANVGQVKIVNRWHVLNIEHIHLDFWLKCCPKTRGYSQSSSTYSTQALGAAEVTSLYKHILKAGRVVKGSCLLHGLYLMWILLAVWPSRKYDYR